MALLLLFSRIAAHDVSILKGSVYEHPSLVYHRFFARLRA